MAVFTGPSNFKVIISKGEGGRDENIEWSWYLSFFERVYDGYGGYEM